LLRRKPVKAQGERLEQAVNLLKQIGLHPPEICNG
jgi:hypothetical protein